LGAIANVASVTVQKLSGLNTLGISLAGFDFAPAGFIPPHYHPRAAEILFLKDGTVEVVMISLVKTALFSKALMQLQFLP
jgi:quercetin dioxygenase-like cupin family protein